MTDDDITTDPRLVVNDDALRMRQKNGVRQRDADFTSQKTRKQWPD